MKPPICVLCNTNKLTPNGRFIQFKLSEKEKKRQNELKNSFVVGQPIGLHWFCEKHAQQITPYKTLYLDEALKKIQDK